VVGFSVFRVFSGSNSRGGEYDFYTIDLSGKNFILNNTIKQGV